MRRTGKQYGEELGQITKSAPLLCQFESTRRNYDTSKRLAREGLELDQSGNLQASLGALSPSKPSFPQFPQFPPNFPKFSQFP